MIFAETKTLILETCVHGFCIITRKCALFSAKVGESSGESGTLGWRKYNFQEVKVPLLKVKSNTFGDESGTFRGKNPHIWSIFLIVL